MTRAVRRQRASVHAGLGSKGLEYTRTRYGAMRTRDFTAFEDASARLRCPGGMRHGTAFAVSPGVAAGLDG